MGMGEMEAAGMAEHAETEAISLLNRRWLNCSRPGILWAQPDFLQKKKKQISKKINKNVIKNFLV